MDTPLDEIMSFARIVRERYSPKAIYLYGSQVKGIAKANSDVDLAVIVEPMDSGRYMSMFSGLFSVAADFESNIEPNLIVDDGAYDKFSFLAEVMETGLLIEG